MSELKANLEALRLRDEAPRPSRSKWVVLGLALVAVVAGGWWWARAGAVAEVETVRAAVQQPSQAQAGAPILTASGYVVARRKAVVSAKIQGRLAELRVEEGSRVVEGETIARLESADYEANLVRARARVDSVRLQIEAYAARIRAAEVNLTESRRQAAVAEKLWAEKVGSGGRTRRDARRVAAAEAALATAQADHASSRSELAQAEADVKLNEALSRTPSSAPRSPARSSARWPRSARASRPFRPASTSPPPPARSWRWPISTRSKSRWTWPSRTSPG